MKSKTTIIQSLQTLLSACLLIMVFFTGTQLSADFDFFTENSDILSQLEKPKLRNDLIDRKRSRSSDNTRARIRFSLDQAASRARRDSGGTVIKARTTWSNGQPIHSIRVKVNNRIRTYRFDGVSGRRL